MDRSSLPSPDIAYDFRSGAGRCQKRTGSSVSASETIPLSDIGQKNMNEALRKVHAQSSAETSGLGDSLQRIHALSSTETSGYGGETGVPSPTGQVSSYASLEDMPVGGTVAGTAGAAMRSPSAAARPSVWVVEKERALHGYGSGADEPPAGRVCRSADHGYDASPPGHVSEDCYEDCFDDHKWQQIHERRQQLTRNTFPGHARRSSEAEQEMERLRSTDADTQGTRFERRGSVGSGDMATGSGANQGGADGIGGGGHHFLGKATQSAWLRWSHERRASFKRKVEFIEQRQTELQKIRMSSPVRKARKESMRFVSPELEDQHMTFNDDLTLAHPAFPFEIPPPVSKKPSRKNEEKEETKLTLAQWNALVAFWEHNVFVRSRCFGLLFGLVSFCLLITGLTTSHWFNIEDHSSFGDCHVGLWQICSSVYDNCTFIEYDKWQIAVIGMTMFSTTFNSMALSLSVLGVCSSSLPKKIYYYHSAGEIHLLCAIGCGVTLLLSPMTIEGDASSASSSAASSSSSSPPPYMLHSFGYSYFVVCVATGCLCVAAFSMCLDDLIRTLARGLCNRSNTSKV